ncbi:MAG: arginyltransferase [Cyanobacteria bacterium]|nr:arginyltransferase [Cyanobacteriota bacterium]
MKIIGRYLSNPTKCGYLPDRQWSLEYEFVSEMSSEEYSERLRDGWRKFGHDLFRPRCPACTECKPIRVLANEFEPNRSQQRTLKANMDIKLEIGSSELSREAFQLYLRHHVHHANEIGWPKPSTGSSISHLVSMSNNPFPIELWSLFLQTELVGMMFVDHLPDGLSLVYSFYDPDLNRRSLGTFMILSAIRRARELGHPYVYLGYFVKDCRSMNYKGKFKPCEMRNDVGDWIRFPK